MQKFPVYTSRESVSERIETLYVLINSIEAKARHEKRKLTPEELVESHKWSDELTRRNRFLYNL